MIKPLLTAFAVAMIARLVTAQTIRGVVVDSASGKGVAGARVAVNGTPLQAAADSLGRFTIPRVLSGEQVLVIHTPSLDSVTASYSTGVTVASGTTNVSIRVPSALQIVASACGSRGYGNGGILLGRLRVADDSTASLAGAISVEWKNPSGADTGKSSATSDSRGRFALCGVPLATLLTLRALTDHASAQVGNLSVPTSARFARTEVVLHKDVATTGTLAGIVTDSANVPVSGVEVSIPDLSQSTLTNEQGAFALRDVPVGAAHVLIRRVGYSPVEAQIVIEAGRTAERHIRLVRATRLDSMVVTEKAVDHSLDEFEVNRKLGLGHFLTRADLAPQEGRSTGATLSTVPGMKVFVFGPYAWVGSGRHNATSIAMSRQVVLDDSDLNKNAPLWDCYALVYLDDHLVWRGQKFPGGNKKVSGAGIEHWEPLFDVNSIPVSEIEAIEYYATSAETPARYATLNSQCGVLVIHTIRFHKPDSGAGRTVPR